MSDPNISGLGAAETRRQLGIYQRAHATPPLTEEDAFWEEHYRAADDERQAAATPRT